VRVIPIIAIIRISDKIIIGIIIVIWKKGKVKVTIIQINNMMAIGSTKIRKFNGV
jgi:hypothetical protein